VGIDLKELEKKYSKNKPKFSFTELIKCLALILAGCALFIFMPDEMGIVGWILFAISAFFNVVGVFRLAAMAPETKGDTYSGLATAIALIAAFFIQFTGLLYLYNSKGSGKGAAIATLAVCISLGLIIHVVDFEDEKLQKKIKITSGVISFLLVAAAIFLNVRDDFSTASIFVGTILLIEAIIAGKIAL